MKRTNAKSVGEIINQLLRQEQLDGKLLDNRACQLWPKIVGPAIAAYTTQVTARQGVMTVTVTSAPLRNDLLLMRNSIITQLNQVLGADAIQDIIFR